MATETVEITTMIGSLCTCASLRVRESVVAFLLMSLIKKPFSKRKTFGFCVVQTDSKYPQNSAKGAFGTSGVMEDYKVGPLLFLRRVARGK